MNGRLYIIDGRFVYIIIAANYYVRVKYYNVTAYFLPAAKLPLSTLFGVPFVFYPAGPFLKR